MSPFRDVHVQVPALGVPDERGWVRVVRIVHVQVAVAFHAEREEAVRGGGYAAVALVTLLPLRALDALGTLDALSALGAGRSLWTRGTLRTCGTRRALRSRRADRAGITLIEIGSASCRERVLRLVSISVVAVSLKKQGRPG